MDIPYELEQLEKEPSEKFIDVCFADEDDNNLSKLHNFLYHGIRFQNYLEKLENIFKCKKILAGKYIEDYHCSIDNCNMGEYVSLLPFLGLGSLEFNKFINENISLVVSPLCEAYQTKYVDWPMWLDIRKNNWKLKNLYSYMKGEFMCKDEVSLDLVLAIGIPYSTFTRNYGFEYVQKLLSDIDDLIVKYDIDLPIVDTENFNRTLSNKAKKI